jgi:serine/threonine-protein phosphatase 4 regulatory subunit 4
LAICFFIIIRFIQDQQQKTPPQTHIHSTETHHTTPHHPAMDLQSLNEILESFSVDEFKEAQQIQDGAKSEEEIQKLTIDEKLSEEDKFKLLANSEFAVQKLSVVSNFGRFVRHHGEYGFVTMFDTVAGIVRDSNNSAEFEQGLLDSLQIILKAGKVDANEFAGKVVPVLTKHIEQAVSASDPSSTDSVVQQWIGLLSPELLIRLGPQQIQKLLEFASEQSHVSQTTAARQVACELLAKITPFCSPSTAVDHIIPQTVLLCRDTFGPVRMSICKHIASIAEAVGYHVTVSKLLPELEVLLTDEEIAVRCAAFRGMCQVFPSLPHDVQQQRLDSSILPYYQHLLEPLYLDVAQQLGPIMHCLKQGNMLTPSVEAVLIKTLVQLSQSDNVAVRRACIFNFPAVVFCTGSGKYIHSLHAVLTRFVLDKDVQVRTTAAACMHQIASLLGSSIAFQHLHDFCITLVRDSNVKVRVALFQHLVELLECFHATDSQQKSSALSLMFSAALNYMQLLKLDWRKLVDAIEKVREFPRFFVATDLQDKLIPAIFEHMKLGCIPVQHAAVKTLCILIRKQPQAFKRIELTQKFVREFGHSKSCQGRRLFLFACSTFMEVFSRRWFITNLLSTCIQMANDPVPTVRELACRLFPTLKMLLRQSVDEQRLQTLERTATQLLSDSVPFVVATATSVAAQLESVSMVIHSHDAAEVDDRKKEAEEDEMLWAEQSMEVGDGKDKLRIIDGDMSKFRRRSGMHSAKPPAMMSSFSNTPNLLSMNFGGGPNSLQLSPARSSSRRSSFARMSSSNATSIASTLSSGGAKFGSGGANASGSNGSSTGSGIGIGTGTASSSGSGASRTSRALRKATSPKGAAAASLSDSTSRKSSILISPSNTLKVGTSTRKQRRTSSASTSSSLGVGTSATSSTSSAATGLSPSHRSSQRPAHTHSLARRRHAATNRKSISTTPARPTHTTSSTKRRHGITTAKPKSRGNFPPIATKKKPAASMNSLIASVLPSGSQTGHSPRPSYVRRK